MKITAFCLFSKTWISLLSFLRLQFNQSLLSHNAHVVLWRRHQTSYYYRTKVACEGVKKYFTSLIKPETNLVCRQLAKVISHNDIEFWLFLNKSCSTFPDTVPFRQVKLKKPLLEYSTLSTRKATIWSWLFIYDSRIPLWRRFSEEGGFSTWQITEALLDKCCSSVLGPTKRVEIQFYYSLLQSIRYGIVNYYYSNIDKNDKLTYYIINK